LSIFGIDYKFLALLAGVTVATTVGISLTYHTITLQIKSKLLSIRGTIKADKKAGKETKETAASKQAVAQARKALHTNVITHESIAFSILFNNTIFLLAVIVFAFYVFPGTPSLYNYILSVGLSLGLLTLITPRK